MNHVRAGEDDDPWDLQRFVSQQNAGDAYTHAQRELARGAKTGHWMWYIFPQMRGLGTTEMSHRFGIRERKEAEAYLAHSVIGPRLLECAETILALEGRTAHQIFGDPDVLKLRSSATLFASVSRTGSVFHRILSKYYAGEPDQRTLGLLEADA